MPRPSKRRKLNPAPEVTESIHELSPSPGAAFNLGVVKIGGNPNVHIGNIYQQNEYKSQLQDLYTTLHDTLSFKGMDARHRGVSIALPGTCHWFLSHPVFKKWDECLEEFSDSHGFLWVKGKPGCGKSVIMKMLCEKVKKRKKKDEITIHYFFNARAPSELEKSSLGLYRSLTYQIVEICPQARSRFLEDFSSSQRSGKVDEWTAEQLREFLISVLALPEQPRINIFVDALDEGQEKDVRDMIGFFERLAKHAKSANARVRACFSSRHYPEIIIQTGLQIRIEDEDGHKDDVETYVRGTLHESQHLEAIHLQTEVCRRSRGVFVWLSLVIPMLNQMIADKDDLDAILDYLGTVPEELDDLFATILKRDARKREECLSLLRLVAFSNRPLESKELYFGVAYERNALAILGATVPEVQELRRYISKTSRGLVEVVEKSLEVQFIHETVRAFLIQEKGLNLIEDSPTTDIEAHGHDQLKQICLQCIAHQAVSSSPLFTRRYRPPKNYDTRIRKLNKDFPFVRYAVTNMLPHADLAQRLGRSQKQFLTSYTRPLNQQFIDFIDLHNYLERYPVREHESTVTMLYVLAIHNYLDLARCLLETGIDVNRKTGRFGSALQAACYSGNKDMVDLLLSKGADVNLVGSSYEHALLAAVHRKDDLLIGTLLSNGATLAGYSCDQAIHRLVANDDAAAAATILDLGADLNKSFYCAHRYCYKHALHMAFAKSAFKVVDVLLEKGVKIEGMFISWIIHLEHYWRCIPRIEGYDDNRGTVVDRMLVVHRKFLDRLLTNHAQSHVLTDEETPAGRTEQAMLTDCDIECVHQCRRSLTWSRVQRKLNYMMAQLMKACEFSGDDQSDFDNMLRAVYSLGWRDEHGDIQDILI